MTLPTPVFSVVFPHAVGQLSPALRLLVRSDGRLDRTLDVHTEMSFFF